MLTRIDSLDGTRLVTHAGCLDGSASAIVFCAAAGIYDVRSPASYERVTYANGRQVRDLAESELSSRTPGRLILCDCSVSAETADMLERRGDVALVDHHESSRHLVGRDWCLVIPENGTCASLMLFRLLDESGLIPSDMRGRLLDLAIAVDDNDRWVNSFESSLALSLLMSFLGQDAFVCRVCGADMRAGFMARGPATDMSFFTAQERDVVSTLRVRSSDTSRSLASQAVIRNVDVAGVGRVKVAWVFAATSSASLLLHDILDMRADVDVAACVDMSSARASLRSRAGSTSALALAEMLGGGGHAESAGFSFGDRVSRRSIISSIVDGRG